tara:strand:+ start:745 stop:1026 length:282 start_codon:yes stop_codon:yes gene_type:complete
MSENVIKFTDAEMQQIAQLQGKYQQKIFELGQLELAKIDLDQQQSDLFDARKKLLEAWTGVQKEENEILQQLSQRYGDGVLSLKDGTFKPAAK